MIDKGPHLMNLSHVDAELLPAGSHLNHVDAELLPAGSNLSHVKTKLLHAGSNLNQQSLKEGFEPAVDSSNSLNSVPNHINTSVLMQKTILFLTKLIFLPFSYCRPFYPNSPPPPLHFCISILIINVSWVQFQ